ncbi:restriction endonuclease subunit S [uncultured Methanobrevibacter sp.]|uniref:restriction endonuclease subunit S n=1 Tax=uncultured Methanobrevibacter sp. TaxID=253161 RepID=UPI0025E4BAF7|nr:restriction endonuclease subunit S [uncultured Methanobrevibacter sp.]
MLFFKHLRFSGFNDEWEIKMLKDVSTVNPKTKDLPNEFVYIDLDSVENGILTKKNKICIDDAPSRAQRLLDVNDILFQTVRPYQMNNLYFDYYDDNYVASTGYAQIKSKINSRYLYHYLHYSKFVNEVLKRCAGSSYPAISSNDLKKIKIKIPSDLVEQMFIGSFFDKIDEKIELLEKKHIYYQNFKKYLMQQIFAQKLRFANFEEDWSTKKLGEIVEFLDNKRIPLNEDERNNQKDIYPYYGASGIIDYVEDYIFDEELILIGEDGTIDVNLASGKYWVSNHAHVLRASEDINQRYLFEFLKTVHFEIYNTGTIQPKLNKETCKTIPIKIPKSLEEQKLIANCLSKAENRIEICQKQINMTNNFKKGLLQQMFV